MTVSSKRVRYFAASVSWIATLLICSIFVAPAFASGQLTNRQLLLQNGTTDGGSKPGGVVNHQFSFTIPQAVGTIHSIVFKYCTNAGTTTDISSGSACTTPAGLKTDATNPTILGTQSGFTFDSLVNTTNGAPYVTSAAGLNTASAATTVSIQLQKVTNPNGTDCAGTNGNCAFYVAVLAYDGAGGTGTLLASGTVAASVNQQIQLSGTMPESLIFCTGGSVTVNSSGIPDCTTATSGSISFNKLFSPTATAFATSQMAASTNALHGYAITVSGAQLANGTNYIKGVGVTEETSASTVGTSVFGMNLVADADATASSPALSPASANLTPASDGVNDFGIAQAHFSTDSKYAFADSGPTGGTLTLNTVAKSDYSAGGPTGTPGPTNGQVYTATYMVNVAANQPAGTYVTTLTYICTPTY
jgi:hypothetical protein